MKRTLKYFLQTLLFIIIFVVSIYPNTINTDSTKSAEITDIRSGDKNHLNEAGLENEIIISVKNAPELNDEELTSQKVILFFDGMPLSSVFPRENNVNKEGNGKLRFFIPHDDNAGKLWEYLLRTSTRGEFFKRLVCINVGLYNPANSQVSHVTNEYFFKIVLVQPIWFWVAVGILLLLLIVFIVLSNQSDVIRDMGCNPSMEADVLSVLPELRWLSGLLLLSPPGFYCMYFNTL